MRYISLFILILFIGCSDEVSPLKECRLTQISVTGTDFVTTTSYTYNASGKMHKQIRTRNGTTIFDYTFSYNTDGKVDKVDMVTEYTQHEYDTDGRIASVKTYSTAGDPKYTSLYNWTADNVKITYTKSDSPNPFQIITLEFLNENIVKKTIQFYSGEEPNVLQTIQVSSFEDFDDKRSAFYIASFTRPGFAVELSKNNPGKVVYQTTNYDSDGAVLQESRSADLYTYTYNTSNAAITSHAELNSGSIMLDTEITYDQCESNL